jgi:hypothetical protein
MGDRRIDSWMRRVASPAVACVAVACAAFATACAPPGGPTGPTWTPTVRLFDEATGVEQVLSATNDSWWAVVETTGGSLTGPATLLLFPRTGPDGAPAAVPSQSIPLGQVASDLAMSEHLLVVRVRNGLAGLDEQRIFELDGDGAAGVWSSAGLVPTAIDTARAPNLDVSDDTLVVGRPGVPGSGAEGSVLLVPLDRTGPGVTWSFGSVQQLLPDPTWSEDARSGFGSQVDVEADAVATTTGAGLVVTGARSGGTWAIDHVLSDPAGLGTGFGRSIALDVSGSLTRLLVGVQGKLDGWTPRPGRADLFTRGPSGWTLERSFTPRPGSVLGGFGLGYAVALDGDTVALGVHWLQPTRPGGVGTIDDLRVEVHELTATPTFVSEVPLMDLAGGPRDDLTAVGPMTLSLSGSHLAVTGLQDPDGPAVHLFAISVDRHPAGQSAG